MATLVASRRLLAFLGCLAVASLAFVSRGSQKQLDGNAPFAPTRLEWAAVELQAQSGGNWAGQTMIHFYAKNDGQTILCLLQYSPATSAVKVKETRAITEFAFEKYKQIRGWPWLRIEFQEYAPNRRVD
jgi:hypothetical protein